MARAWNSSTELHNVTTIGAAKSAARKWAQDLLVPYDSQSSVHFQIGIGAPKRHLFDRQFCVGFLQTFCKQWPKGPGKILKFWPLHSVRQNVSGFRRGLFTCFLGHTPLSQYYLLFGPHPLLQLWRTNACTTGCNLNVKSMSATPCCWTPLFSLDIQIAASCASIVLHNSNKWCGPKSR